MRRTMRVLLSATLTVGSSVSLVSTAGAAPRPARPARAELRVDQAGYLARETKAAVLMSGRALGHRRVHVVNAGRVVPTPVRAQRRAAWSDRYPFVYLLRFGRLSPGRYRLALGDTRSLPFRVAGPGALWVPVLRDGVRFFQAQRDGGSIVPILQRRPSHLGDRHTDVYARPHFVPGSDLITDRDLRRIGGPVDVGGGWFDAGDYVKFVHTTAYADVLLFTAARELGRGASVALLHEARHGLAWLGKMWRPRTRTMYLQVGVGSGNRAGTFRGDHDLWRLPQRDDHYRSAPNRYLAHRPVFLAAPPGHRISPNLVGRTTAAFALAAQLDARRRPGRARHELRVATGLYEMAATANPPHPLATALPHAFYPESSWHDDMELGGAELALAAQRLHRPALARHYRAVAGHWARAYLRTDAGGDTFNLYDVGALAHHDLATQLPPRSALRRRLVADLARQLGGAAHRSARDPFGAGVDDTEFDVDSHSFGLVATAQWYASLTGSHRFDRLAATLRGWLFGANAWGTSFMVGIGTRFPRCMQHQVANLAGSTNGRPPLVLGAVVNGPNGAGLFAGGLGGYQDGMVHCADSQRRFDGSGSVYLDDTRSWQTDEPALDMTGAALIAAAGAIAARRR